ncbi:MAG: phosphotransferase [Oscillospiraceae bacterium]
MDREYACSKIDEAIKQYSFNNKVKKYSLYGNGHINDTFLIECEDAEKFIMQRMNHEIFKNPSELMENITSVTAYLREKIIARGGDYKRETLNVVDTLKGDKFYKDSIGCYWRVYLFVDDGLCYDSARTPEDFYQSGYAFGNFQRLLADYPASTLHETIPDFHNNQDRYQNFINAVKNDKCGRVKDVRAEIDFIIERKSDTDVCNEMLKNGELPLRVTHNDTKLNNVMIDNKTGEAMCVLDLDTVMPGLSINDFGDSIRFGASTASEDETDLNKVSMDLDLFESYTKGFLKACGESLTAKEKEMLAFGAKMMTFECGMRFLTDHLEGDTYFRIHRENHNLDRARTQLKLVADMESKWQKMGEIVEKYC